MTRSGVLNIDKPLGVTSHDVVAQVRRTLGESRVGHAGTLDPLATGVLIVCVGPAVRLSEFLMASSKMYVADVRLGRITTTDDGEGQITAELPIDFLDAAQITAALPAFTGEIEQIPPDYSAVKQGGKKLYQLARQGKTVEAAPRRVRIDSLRLFDWTPPVARIEMVCGPGTYVRSLARDLGQTLGVGGSLAGLRRTVSGVFRAEEGVAAAALSDAEALAAALMPLRRALAGWPVVSLDAAALNDVLHGRRVQAEPLPLGTLALGVTVTGDVAALLRAVADGWQPERVLVS
jgi:tRNA pseudouridine55 synthase